MSFNPPSGVTNGAEYQYGNVVWRFDASSGVWNIVDASLVGSQGAKGDQGDLGPAGPTGGTGATGAGATGDAGAFIVNASLGAGTVRIAQAGATGVASFDPRFFSLGASGHIKLGGSLLGISISDQGKNSDTYGWGDSIDISGTGGIQFNRVSKGEYQILPTGQVLGVTGIGFSTTDTGLTGKINLTAANGINLTRSGNTLTYSAQNFVFRDSTDTNSTNALGIGTFTITGGTGISTVLSASKDEIRISSRIAEVDGSVGVASFESTYFQVNGAGRVSLVGAYAATGDTIQAGSAINIGTGKVINNIGVTSFNGATGAINFTIPLAGATSGVTGTASFNANRFQVSVTGNVDLVAAYQVTGDTIVAGSAINFSTSGRTKTLNNIGVTAFNGATGAMTVTGSQHGIPYINTSFRAQGGLTASAAFLFNGTALTFGSSTSTFTVTGPNMVLGAATEITGGVFKNPTESAPHFTITTTNDIVVNGISGSIQRFTITPSAKVTIKAGTGWHALNTATETIALIIQNNSSFTGSFDSNILVDGSGAPILFGPDTTTNYGVTGGVSVVTLMRVNKGSGAGLTMGFVISTGMTAANITIN